MICEKYDFDARLSSSAHRTLLQFLDQVDFFLVAIDQDNNLMIERHLMVVHELDNKSWLVEDARQNIFH
jgi:hypothetical protein